MHELSIAESIVEAVLDRTGEQHVTAVRIQIGRLSGVTPDALTFCFELATAGTALEGAALEIEHCAGRVRCRSCDRVAESNDLILLCPCGSADVDVVAGRELQLTSVEVK